MKIVENDIYAQTTYRSVWVELDNGDGVCAIVISSFGEENIAPSVTVKILWDFFEEGSDRKLSEEEEDELISFIKDNYAKSIDK